MPSDHSRSESVDKVVRYGVPLNDLAPPNG